jgi:hypothetical protein
MKSQLCFHWAVKKTKKTRKTNYVENTAKFQANKINWSFGIMWKNWKKTKPSPGTFVYVRDLDGKEDWEIGWAVGEGHYIKVVLVNDPSMSQLTYDEWQLVPNPLD